MTARILIIEDNPTNLELMQYLLKAFGHNPTGVSSGEEGLKIAGREIPDLVICDIQLPKMDGFAVARCFRSDSKLSNIPLVAVTAFAMVGDRDKVLASGFNGYISKPLDPLTFVPQLEVFLNPGLCARNSNQSQAALPTTTGVSKASTVSKDGLVRSNIRAATTDQGGITVLVVDNAFVNRELMISMLQPFNYKIILADEVSQALELARQHIPDVILSDVHVPVADGFDFIKAVKADPVLQSIPFIFISSTVLQDQDPLTGLALGAAKFLIRPIEPQKLIEELEECLPVGKRF